MASVTHDTGYGMPPKLEKDTPSGRVNIVATETLIRRMDKLRAERWPIPTKSEAARVLIEMALDLIEESAEARSDFNKRLNPDR